MRIALAILLALPLGPALAQEEVADALPLALRDGFELVEGWHRGDQSAFGDELDRLVVGPFMRSHAPRAGYSFTFRQLDTDGDGDGDVVISLRTDAHLSPCDGGAVLVSMFEGGSQSQPELSEAMHVVMQDPGDRPDWEVAVVQADNYVLVGEQGLATFTATRGKLAGKSSDRKRSMSQ